MFVTQCTFDCEYIQDRDSNYDPLKSTIRKKYNINDKNGKLREVSKLSVRNNITKRKQKRASQHAKRMKMKIPLCSLNRGTSKDSNCYNAVQVKKQKPRKCRKRRHVVYTNKSSFHQHQKQKQQTEQQTNSKKQKRLFLGIEFGETSSTKRVFDYNFVKEHIFEYHEIVANSKPRLSSSHSFLWLLITSPSPHNPYQRNIARSDAQTVHDCVHKLNQRQYGEDAHVVFDTLYECKNPFVLKRRLTELRKECARRSQSMSKTCIPIVYYSGHGMEKTGNWILDGSKTKQISLRDLLLPFKQYKSLMIVSDCCYSGAFLKALDDEQKGQNEDQKKNKEKQEIRQMVQEYDNLIIFASSDHNERSQWERSFTQWAFNNSYRPLHTPYLYVNGKKRDISHHFVWDFHL